MGPKEKFYTPTIAIYTKERMPPPKVFIAWGGSRGRQIGERLHHALKRRKVDAFISSRDMRWGEPDWEAKLRQTIKTSDAFILVCTREACCSWNVMKELEWARKGPLIMPLKIKKEPLHPMVTTPNAHSFNPLKPDYDLCKRELIKGLDELRKKINTAKNPMPMQPGGSP
jgi:hypothetical protein